ncbi:MAG TPA: hypothetical protein VFT87_03300 [Candidatus Saccharimonadales bacterium]|nr:hypothetical protein [Candidatus Saccharimonadales bacterium]
MKFQQVCLAGTTAGRTWQQEVMQRLRGRGVGQEQIFYSQLANSAQSTEHDTRREEAAQEDPSTIMLIYVCPPGSIRRPSDRAAAEILDPFALFLIGTYGMCKPHRTAVVFEELAFAHNGESRKILEKIKNRLVGKFGQPGPPYFERLSLAEDWIVTQLT